jgi:predicted nucleic acid-binding protein
MIVVDVSAVFGFIFPDERTPYAVSLAEYMMDNAAAAPDFFRIEAANILRTQEKRGRWQAEEVDILLRDLESLDIRWLYLDRPWFNPAWLLQLQRRHSLTTYDAVYLATALHLAVPLATTDAVLAEAAQREGLYWKPV